MVKRIAAFLVAALGATVVFASPDALPAEFRFISRETTLQQVIDRVGSYSRVRGSGIQAFEYDLPDGSAVLLFPDHPFKPNSRIRKTQFYPTKEQIEMFP